MKLILFFITINIVIMSISIFIDLVYAEQNDVDGFIEKPNWCNSASISHYYILIESPKEYKYPCATFM
ncbi:MAG: hypothetical protein R3321_06020 [Nitrososphaeraceae archaeon]|nr:hypothetical protein [Nitrososphaeraceae archaeon]